MVAQTSVCDSFPRPMAYVMGQIFRRSAADLAFDV